ncbi:MAG: hypothetical protein KIT72_13110 [Polyangiaceae bacterium]|nr:hypothetical protein [Polyangiaceae bacterium]MCW5791350.1 hypothetical protein [Polyangiaceae bacterium]
MDVQCQDCGALLHLAPNQRTTTCFYCRSPAIVSRPGDPRRPTPRFAVPFVLQPELAYARARSWQNNLSWFRGPELRNAAITGLQPIYAPCFLYSAIARSAYSVSIGENYTTGSGDNQRTHTEWRPLHGEHAAFVRDVVVSASRGILNAELECIEPFDLRALHRYTPALISGWPAEEPSSEPQMVWAMAREEARQDIARRLHQFMPGDCYRGLKHQTELGSEALELVLMPLWVLPVRVAPNQPPVRLLVNGQTGKVYGPARMAWGRVILLIALVIGGFFLFSFLLFACVAVIA